MQILNHKILTLERGWTKTHCYFIQMGGFMLFEGNIAKGVLSPERFSQLLTAGKIEFPTASVKCNSSFPCFARFFILYTTSVCFSLEFSLW